MPNNIYAILLARGNPSSRACLGPPHDPYDAAPEKYRAMYSPSKLTLPANLPEDIRDTARKRMAGYYAHCSPLDDCLGELRADTQGSRPREEHALLIFHRGPRDLLGAHGGWNKQRPYDE